MLQFCCNWTGILPKHVLTLNECCNSVVNELKQCLIKSSFCAIGHHRTRTLSQNFNAFNRDRTETVPYEYVITLNACFNSDYGITLNVTAIFVNVEHWPVPIYVITYCYNSV